MNREDGIDNGVPIDELREQEMETSPAFTAKVRRRIHRRAAAGQVAAYSWNLPKVALLEMARLLSHVVGTFGAGKDRE